MRVADLRIAALHYVVGLDDVAVVVLDQQARRQTFPLGRWRDLFPLIDELTEALAQPPRTVNPDPPQLRAFADEWGARLLPPADILDGVDVLVIVAHHRLHALPLHLVRRAGRPLAVTHGVTYSPSATGFVRARDRNLARRHDLTTWTYAEDAAAATGAPPAPRRCIGVGVDVLGPLHEQYRALTDAFAQRFAEPFTQCDNRMLKVGLRGERPWEVVCIASHGHVDSSHPDNTGLLLGRERGGLSVRPIPLHRGQYFDFRDLPFQYLPAQVRPRRDAELMTVGELRVDGGTDAQLVALFGCSTGAGHLISADNYQSMAGRFLQIGAASTLANGWEVDIDFMRQWSALFLTNWLDRRQPKAIAWRNANAATVTDQPTISPYRWGAITLAGDWL